MVATCVPFVVSFALPLCSFSQTSIRIHSFPNGFRTRLRNTRGILRSPSQRHFHSINIVPSSASASKKMEAKETTDQEPIIHSMNILFVEMGVGYDQHGQDITAAAMRACRDAITSNSVPAFRTGLIPGVSYEQMKLQIKLGIPRSTQQFLDIKRVKSIFPYGQIISFEVMDGGMICSSGVCLEAMGDKNDDCYVVNAAVYVGY